MKKIIFSFLCLFSLQIQANLFTQKKAHDAYQSGNFAEAQSAYTQMLTEKPYDAQNNYNLGCTLHKQKKFEDAQNYFNRAVEHAEPNSKLQEQALFNRGNNFFQQKNWDEAIADYKKVLKMNPNNESAKKNLKAAEQMKKEEKKQQEQKKDKNKDQKQDKNDQQQNQNSQDEDSKNQDSSNQDSSNQDSKDDSDKNDQSSNQKKDQQGDQKKSSQGKSKDQKGDQKNEGNEKEESKQEQADGLKKSKKQEAKEQKNGQKQKEANDKHEKSSEKSTQSKSTNSNDDGKEEKVELNDAYAQEMMNNPSDDDRLEKRSAMLLEKLDDYEKNIQKKLLQMNVTKQGAQKHGQKNW
ncbi:tetratricopeptide repeat protein [Candidatus Babeliales bacterium]|nr:tetratricopeptide repeat protein [Candidatus Babeliales bacterium]